LENFNVISANTERVSLVWFLLKRVALQVTCTHNVLTWVHVHVQRSWF